MLTDCPKPSVAVTRTRTYAEERLLERYWLGFIRAAFDDEMPPSGPRRLQELRALVHSGRDRRDARAPP